MACCSPQNDVTMRHLCGYCKKIFHAFFVTNGRASALSCKTPQGILCNISFTRRDWTARSHRRKLRHPFFPMTTAKISRQTLKVGRSTLAALEPWTAPPRESQRHPYKQTRREIAISLRRFLRAAHSAK